MLTNPALHDMVKIGMTERLAEDRARQLSGTGLPHPFEVAHRAITSAPRAVEARVHELLADRRVARNREFFAVEPGVAVAAIRDAQLRLTGIESWDTPEPVQLAPRDRLGLTLRAGQCLVRIGRRTDPSDLAPVLDIWQAHADGDLLELMGTSSSRFVAGFGHGDEGSTLDPVPHLDRRKAVPNGIIIGRERMDPGERLLWSASAPPGCAVALFEMNSFCQVVCRTWTPRTASEGYPLILNAFTDDDLITPGMRRVVRAAPGLPAVEVTFRPDHDDVHGRSYGQEPPPPDFWLQQLRRPPR